MPGTKRVYRDKYVSVGRLVSSQEQRALLITVINRTLTARQPVVVFLYLFT